MQQQVNAELAHIPKGGGGQGALRMGYNARRLSDLASPRPRGRGAVLRDCLRALGVRSDGEPRYDPAFFRA